MDQKLLFVINREWTNGAMDLFMAGLTSFDVWIPLIVVLAVFILVRGNFRARAFLLTVGLVVGVNDGVVSNSLKKIVDRPRPHQSHNDVRQVELAKAKPRLLALFKPVKTKMSRVALKDVEGRSFPSSHTMNTTSAAVVALCFYGWRAWWGVVIAGLIGYSRIYTGSHWPSDVVTSVFLGVGFSLLWLAGIGALWRRQAARWLPRVHAEHPRLFAA
jgi:undecaprenyl-diphosphatase